VVIDEQSEVVDITMRNLEDRILALGGVANSGEAATLNTAALARAQDARIRRSGDGTSRRSPEKAGRVRPPAAATSSPSRRPPGSCEMSV
jgi:hypothetical protein